MAAVGTFLVTVSYVIHRYNLRQVQVPLSGTVQEVHIAITPYPGVSITLPKLQVLPNFRVSH